LSERPRSTRYVDNRDRLMALLILSPLLSTPSVLPLGIFFVALERVKRRKYRILGIWGSAPVHETCAVNYFCLVASEP
jgi:hypothetical protein